MERLLRELDRAAASLPRTFIPRRPGPPVSFRRFAERFGRFELSYPASWFLSMEDGSLFASSPSGTFARVEVVSEGTNYWGGLEKAAAACGGCFRIDVRRAGPPERARGELSLDDRRFAWDGIGVRVGGDRVVLTLGNVVGAARGALLERYEDKVLDAVRRSFKAPAEGGK